MYGGYGGYGGGGYGGGGYGGGGYGGGYGGMGGMGGLGMRGGYGGANSMMMNSNSNNPALQQAGTPQENQDPRRSNTSLFLASAGLEMIVHSSQVLMHSIRSMQDLISVIAGGYYGFQALHSLVPFLRGQTEGHAWSQQITGGPGSDAAGAAAMGSKAGTAGGGTSRRNLGLLIFGVVALVLLDKWYQRMQRQRFEEAVRREREEYLLMSQQQEGMTSATSHSGSGSYMDGGDPRYAMRHGYVEEIDEEEDEEDEEDEEEEEDEVADEGKERRQRRSRVTNGEEDEQPLDAMNCGAASRALSPASSKKRREKSQAEEDEQPNVNDTIASSGAFTTSNGLSVTPFVESNDLFVSLYDYVASGPNQLSFKSGDQFIIENYDASTWCVATTIISAADDEENAARLRHHQNPARGIIPGNFVERLRLENKL